MSAEITLTIKQRCQCGHTWEQELEIKQDEGDTFVLKSIPSPLIASRNFKSGTQLEFTGRVESTKISGIDVIVGIGVVCCACGQKLIMYGEKQVDSTIKEP